MTPDSAEPLLSVRDLRIAFAGIEAVRGLSFDVHPGEVLALVGESGAGKSLTARALLGMVPGGARTGGSVRLRQTPGSPPLDLLTATPAELRSVRGRRIALVPQDALSALSPVHPVGAQLAAAIRSVTRLPRKEAKARAIAALDRVGIPDAARKARAHPHEYSGGMRQRAVIAMATINEPDILIADEPTTALDEERRDQVLKVLAEQRETLGAALVLVTHDVEAVRRHADRVLVMYAGREVELGPAARLLGRPLAPYTAGLLASLPREDLPRRRRLPTLPGTPPVPTALPPGCAFAPRCPLATEFCHREMPEPWTTEGRRVSCHRWDEVPRLAAELFKGPA
ncbi:ABC transporter ATP-binding protein [Streptomyces sp. NPDC047081]|uniref:ABC transporter ATP-binding protein n=1 Tax=Streptomyces sp. NPDC047081 TaxID=3154706 RepID=UPI0033F0BBC3